MLSSSRSALNEVSMPMSRSSTYCSPMICVISRPTVASTEVSTLSTAMGASYGLCGPGRPGHDVAVDHGGADHVRAGRPDDGELRLPGRDLERGGPPCEARALGLGRGLLRRPHAQQVGGVIAQRGP